MSPKDKRQLAREHLQVAQSAVQDGRVNEAVNALFYAAEAASSPLPTSTTSTPRSSTG